MRMPAAVIVPARGVSLVTVGMSVGMSARAEIAQRTKGDPQAESDQRQARNRVDGAGKLARQCGPGDPNDDTDRQRGERVAETGARGHPGDLGARPPLLTGQKRYRQPMVGNKGVEHTDGGDRNQ
jgi:hypothetical protein